MDEKLMDNEQRRELFKAISKLSEEEQLQIAGSGKITEEQCKKIKALVDPAKLHGALIGYGAPMPYQYDIAKPDVSKWFKKQQLEEQKTQDIAPTENPQPGENSL